MATRLIAPFSNREPTMRFPSWSNKTLFTKQKPSDEWHEQITFTAGPYSPSDPVFPWSLLRKHTDYYIKKKGKLTQGELDARLGTLIEQHERRDVAIAACAHAMSADAIRALLNVELQIAPASYKGLDSFMQSLIAANHACKQAVSDLEALWARQLLPYMEVGTGAAGRFLEGVCHGLLSTNTRNLNDDLPYFAMLIRRASRDFLGLLEGMRLRCDWIGAAKTVAWMGRLLKDGKGKKKGNVLIPEHVLDSQAPLWRIWARWRPDCKKLEQWRDLGAEKRAVLYDLLALEGPDFVSGEKASLREGLVVQYAAAKRLVRFKSIILELPGRSTTRTAKEALAEMLHLLSAAVGTVLEGGDGHFALFAELAIKRPITHEALQVLHATSKIKDTPRNLIHAAVLDIYTNREDIQGRHILPLLHVLCAMDDDESGRELCDVLLKPWLVAGIERCISQCQLAVRTHMESGMKWSHFIIELGTFCSVVKDLDPCYTRLDDKMKARLDCMPEMKMVKTVLEIHDKVGYEGDSDEMFGNNCVKNSIEDWCVDRMIESKSLGNAERIVDTMVEVWNGTEMISMQESENRRNLAIMVSKFMRVELDAMLQCLKTITKVPDEIASELLSVLQSYNGEIGKFSEVEASCLVFLRLLTRTETGSTESLRCWKHVLYAMIDGLPPTAVLDFMLSNFPVQEWFQIMVDLNTLFADAISNAKASPPLLLQARLHLWAQRLSGYIPALIRLEDTLANQPRLTAAARVIFKYGEGKWSDHLINILSCLTRVFGFPAERLMQRVVGKLGSNGESLLDVSACVVALMLATPEGLDHCEQIWEAFHGASYATKQDSKNMELLETPNATKTISNDSTGSASFYTAPDHLSADQETSPEARKSLSTKLLPTKDLAPILKSLHATGTSQAITREHVTSPMPVVVVEVMVAGFLQDDRLVSIDEVAMKALSKLLNIQIYDFDIPTWMLDEAGEYWAEEECKILEEAQRLDALKKALKAKDPAGTVLLLELLGVEDTNPLDEELQNLPFDVAGAVEKCNDNEIEITFSLGDYTDLQRSGFDIGDAKALYVRLCLDYSGELPAAFCLHLDTDTNHDNVEHTPWVCFSDSDEPVNAYCWGRMNMFVWQLSRILHRNLQPGTLDIAGIHALIKPLIDGMSKICVVCGRPFDLDIRLRRPLHCVIASCTHIWKSIPLDIRHPELRTDPFSVDLILTAVYVAAMNGDMSLLPGCPLTTPSYIQGVLNALPSLNDIKNAHDISYCLAGYSQNAEKLIVWALTFFRGYLTTASGMLKIPSMPTGTHQFVLSSAAPALEAAYTSRLSSSSTKTTVLFHGTSLDRLPSILAHGLKIYSGTHLQRTGAAHGKGIYLGEEPSTSFSYAPSAISWKNSGLNSMRLLLGCEVIGGGRYVGTGIHVVQDEQTVMVRYVFLLPGGSYAPVPQHIVPAMASAMSALRSGAV
ncbi:hypothetical protein P280DRAFT_549357 [Massarina eburnea CBS 473.64]|uniref:Poly [ADP-ribose] polymerase n=1 Tax=Massarina eburnea CBS 473.64 TaxID=1395130 RepID=A0A6A6S241_9PLEO|nr:hypothetical protein P280DRAFT_549357 [Massarina eburnea CBS 473.64]